MRSDSVPHEEIFMSYLVSNPGERKCCTGLKNLDFRVRETWV
jgi:hypothetical protein